MKVDLCVFSLLFVCSPLPVIIFTVDSFSGDEDNLIVLCTHKYHTNTLTQVRKTKVVLLASGIPSSPFWGGVCLVRG